MNGSMRLAAAFVCAVCLAAGAEAKEGRRPDAWITTKVKTSLAAHRNVRAFGTDVTTKNGVVTLRGEVATAAEKELAGRYAKEIEGVRSVDNQLMIRGEEGKGPGDRAIDRLGEASLTARVKAALAGQRGASAIRTDVDSHKGVVTLRGTARSEAEKDLAEKTVRDVEGVREVDNRIEIDDD